MPNIFDSIFEEVTSSMSKTNTIFIEYDACTFQDKYDDLEIDGQYKDVIYNSSTSCFKFVIFDQYIVIIYQGDELSSYLIHGFKSFYKDFPPFTLAVYNHPGEKQQCVCRSKSHDFKCPFYDQDQIRQLFLCLILKLMFGDIIGRRQQ